MTDSLTVFGTDYTGVTGIKAKGTGNGTLTYIRPQGTKSISANGTGIDVASYASVDVSVGGSSATLQAKTDISPTESSQTVTPDTGYDGLSSVQINAISSTYVGSGITRRSSSDLTASGATVTVPSGYYSEDGSKAVKTGTAGTPTASKGTVSNHSVSVTPSVSNVAGYINGGIYNGTAVTVTASELVSGTKSISANGTGIDVTNYASVDVAVPAPAPNLQTITKSYTPSETAQSETITSGTGYDGIGEVDVTVGAISSTYVGSGITQRSSSDLTASGATITVPAGYYASAASKAVASGTAGTPTASKGSVSNHSVSVTPSVTNTTGYIAGETKTGTAVTVSASELVSGTYTVDSSGTKDVTNYASASVPSGGATASASKGSVSNHSVSVTPTATCTAGWVSAGTANGTAVTVSASELVSGTLSITSSGTKDVTNYASASVAAGGATASATKGSVSNHSITVTPSVTRTAGYVTAGTANGTAVTVSASELVSGSETKTANGTYDVTNLASLVVALSYSTIYTSSSNPTSSQGANGDIWLVTS